MPLGLLVIAIYSKAVYCIDGFNVITFSEYFYPDKRKDEDYDDETEELLVQEDDEDVYILSKISDLVHSLFGTHKEEFATHFETLLHHFVKLLVSITVKYKL